MAKLIITIEEKTESIEDNRTLYGFGVTQDVEAEDPELSMLPVMAPLLTEIVMRAIALIQQANGGCLHKAGTCDRSVSLDSHVAELKAELAQPFPSEL
jgi:hypothetical protein